MQNLIWACGFATFVLLVSVGMGLIISATIIKIEEVIDNKINLKNRKAQ